ncbi:6,7-dimethyl-8-ribityllumazine synthase [Polaromonas sp. YR568]|uniref:6,7-dimethyl-8-ribityllumazine synthase n=1 Tax=Polaromonas sp. YR568 TaxID=1855301 RepID=UPI00398BF553
MSQTNSSVASPSAMHSAGAPKARFAFIQSSWHEDIVDQGRGAFLAEMARQGVGAESIDTFEVPGAFEIPLHAKKLAQSGRYAGIVCCGLVVDGGIYRHEFVADAVISALMGIQLETGVPVFSAVLTPQHFHEHEEHRRFFTAHFLTKGKEVAQACLETVAGLKKLESLLAA